jgi:hypothetical protein
MKRRSMGWAILLAMAVIVMAARAEAYEFTPEQQQLLDDFLRKYPEADGDGDGTLIPSEVWVFRSKTMREKGKTSEEGQAAQALMKKTYAPCRIDADKVYGPAEGKKLKFFILSGQSNMGGQGVSTDLSEEMLSGSDRLLMFEQGKWQPLRPLGFSFGPEIGFGHAMAKAWPDETIGIVKQAKGGTGVLAWSPTWTKEKADLTRDGDKGNLWKELTDKVRAAREAAECEVLGFVWQQGAKDMQRLETGKQYLQNLKDLVEGLREETGAPDMAFVLGSYRGGGIPDDLSDIDPATIPSPGRAGAAWVLKAQWDAQTVIAPAKTVPLRDLSKWPYNIHADTKALLTMGKLFAEGYLELTRGTMASGGPAGGGD